MSFTYNHYLIGHSIIFLNLFKIIIKIMKLWKKLKNGRLSEKDNLSFTCHWSNPPRTWPRPRKAKTQIALALFRSCGFLLSRSCGNEIWGACSLCFIYFLLFNIAYAIYLTSVIYRRCDISYMRYWKAKIKNKTEAAISFSKHWDSEKTEERKNASAICILPFRGRGRGGLLHW